MLGHVSYVESSPVSSFIPGSLLYTRSTVRSSISNSQFFLLFQFSLPFFSLRFSVYLRVLFGFLRFTARRKLERKKKNTKKKQKKKKKKITRPRGYLRTEEGNSVKFSTERSLAPYSSHCDQFSFILSLRPPLF